MNNDPYSWFNIDRLDRMIKEQKEEFKKKELEEELKDEKVNSVTVYQCRSAGG